MDEVVSETSSEAVVTAPEPTRKRGQRKPSFGDEDDARLVKTAKSMVRTDWAGRDPLEQIRAKLRERGVEAGLVSCAAILSIIEAQVDACRKRQFPRLDELLRRIEQGAVLETLADPTPPEASNDTQAAEAAPQTELFVDAGEEVAT